MFYSTGDRGGSPTEKLLLELILLSNEDSSEVHDWAANALEDIQDYVDGSPWDVPSTWKKGNVRYDVVLRFSEFLKVTPAIIDNVRFAAAKFDGPGRTSVVLEAAKIMRWLSKLLAVESSSFALLGFV